MSISFDFPHVERFTVGAIGEPGSRVFLLQAQEQTVVCTIKVEKTQVSALCTYLGDMLGELASPAPLPTDLDLSAHVEPEWTAGSISASYDEDVDRIVIFIEQSEQYDPILEIIETGATASWAVTREQASAFAIHGTRLVQAGRPPCPLCGYPLDASGHFCPRQNGHRPPSL